MLIRPFKRVKMLDANEYRVLKKAVASRKLAARKARWAKIVLLSNQGHTAREIAAELGCNERTALEPAHRTGPRLSRRARRLAIVTISIRLA